MRTVHALSHSTHPPLFPTPCWHFPNNSAVALIAAAPFQRRWWVAWMSKWNISPRADALCLNRTHHQQEPPAWNDIWKWVERACCSTLHWYKVFEMWWIQCLRLGVNTWFIDTCATAMLSFLSRVSINPKWHSPVYVYRRGRGHVSVRVYSLHVSWGPCWWIRAGTNLLVHLWNENQGRGDRQSRAPSHSHQASYRHNLTLYGLTFHTHAHKHSYTHSTPCDLSLSFPSFFFHLKALHKAELTVSQIWEPLAVPDMSDHIVDMREANMLRKEKMEQSQYVCRVQPKGRWNITFTATPLLSFVCRTVLFLPVNGFVHNCCTQTSFA